MASVVYTGANAQKLIKPEYIVLTLFTGTESDSTPLGTSYILEDVIEDTTSISQDDNNTTDIECETSDSPVVSIVKIGKYQVSAEVGDTQSAILKDLCDFTADTSGNKVYAPSVYRKKYAKFDVVFKTGDNTYSAFVVPKLQLNSKLMIESLNSNLGRVSLAGTAQDVVVTIGEKKVRTPFYKDENYTLPTAGK